MKECAGWIAPFKTQLINRFTAKGHNSSNLQSRNYYFTAKETKS